MKKVLMIVFFVGWVLQGVAQVMFQKTYGGIGTECGRSVQQLPDSGYLIGGTNLIRTNPYGDTLLYKNLGSTFNSAEPTMDGGYILGPMPVKTDSNGNVLWAKSLGWNLGPCSFNVIEKSIDGGFLVGGTAFDTSDAMIDFNSIFKINASGNFEWLIALNDEAGPQQPYAITQTSDSCYIATYKIPNDAQGIGLIKFNQSGTILFGSDLGAPYFDNLANSVIQTMDGGYIIAGHCWWSSARGKDVYLIKTTSTGILSWSRVYGGTGYDVANCVQQTRDGGYIITGTTTSFGAGDSDVYLIKTNASGDTLWTRTYGGPNADEGYSAQQTNDGGYIIVGQTKSFGAGGSDIYLIKTDAFGNSGCNENNTSTIINSLNTDYNNWGGGNFLQMGYSVPTTINLSNGGLVTNICSAEGIQAFNNHNSTISIYPNPTTSTFTITLNDQSSFINSQLKIYDVTGRVMHEQGFDKFSLRNASVTEPVEVNCKLNAGIYFLKISDGEKNFTQKLIVE